MNGKKNPTKDHFREYQHFFLRREVWQAIKKTHGWKNHGAITRFAELRKKDYRTEKKSDFSLVFCRICDILDFVMRDIKKILTQNQIKNPGSIPRISTRIGVSHDTGVLFFSGIPLPLNFCAYLVVITHMIATTYVGLLNNFTKLSMSWSKAKDRLFFLPSWCAWSGFQETADHLARTDVQLN